MHRHTKAGPVGADAVEDVDVEMEDGVLSLSAWLPDTVVLIVFVFSACVSGMPIAYCSAHSSMAEAQGQHPPHVLYRCTTMGRSPYADFSEVFWPVARSVKGMSHFATIFIYFDFLQLLLD